LTVRVTSAIEYGDNLQVLRDSIATESVDVGYYETDYGKYPKQESRR
jgi:hypothetical protein